MYVTKNITAYVVQKHHKSSALERVKLSIFTEQLLYSIFAFNEIDILPNIFKDQYFREI